MTGGVNTLRHSIPAGFSISATRALKNLVKMLVPGSVASLLQNCHLRNIPRARAQVEVLSGLFRLVS